MTNGVEFEIDNEPRAVVQTKTPAMVKLVIKLSGGLIKDEQQANYILIGLAIVAFSISIFLFNKSDENLGQRTVSQEPPSLKAARESQMR